MSVYTLASSVESEVDDIASNTSTKIAGSGTATRLSKFTASRTLADSSIQETVSPSGGSISVSIGGSPDNNYRIRIQGDLIVDDNPGSALGWGIALTTDSDFSNRPLITRKKDAFNSGRYSAFVGRWGLFMETNDLFWLLRAPTARTATPTKHVLCQSEDGIRAAFRSLTLQSIA